MKRLTIDIPDELHKEIKVRATNRMMSMKKWTMLAIMDFIRMKELYEIEEQKNANTI